MNKDAEPLGVTANEEKKLLAQANVLFGNQTWNEILVIVFGGIKAEEASAALTEDQMIDISISVVTSLKDEMAGTQPYLPMTKKSLGETAKRFFSIYEKCRGIPSNEVAKEMGLSLRHTYRIFKKIQEMKREENRAKEVDRWGRENIPSTGPLLSKPRPRTG